MFPIMPTRKGTLQNPNGDPIEFGPGAAEAVLEHRHAQASRCYRNIPKLEDLVLPKSHVNQAFRDMNGRAKMQAVSHHHRQGERPADLCHPPDRAVTQTIICFPHEPAQVAFSGGRGQEFAGKKVAHPVTGSRREPQEGIAR
jgi:hypothetical protein